MKINHTGFPVPVLGPASQELFKEVYGENASVMLEVLNDAPAENAVISVLLAYSQKLKEDR